MDKYLEDHHFRTSISNLADSYKKTKQSHLHTFDTIYDFKEYTLNFARKYINDLLNPDFLNAIKYSLNGSKLLSACRLILNIAEEMDELTKLKLIEFIVHNFDSHEIEKCKSLFQFNFFNYEIWIQYIDLLANKNFNFIKHENNSNLQRHARKLIYSYIDKTNIANQFKSDIEMLKEKVESLELQIDYMPGGEGYNQTKAHFEFIQKERYD